jgi:predicted TIM-barrel fold metal-dependent hydrolase
VEQIADAHLHLFTNGFRGRGGSSPAGPGLEVDAYELLARRHGVVAGLVIGYEGEGIDPVNNSYIRSLAVSHPWMSTVAYVSANAAPDPARLDGLLELGHRGIALYVSGKETAGAVSSWPADSWRCLEERRAIVSVNASPAGTQGLFDLVERTSGCTFLFSHLGEPGRFTQPPSADAAAHRLGALLRLAGNDHVYVKISGLYAISDPATAYPHEAAWPFIDLVLEAFGPSHCLWGSDFSPCLDDVSFEQVIRNPVVEGLPAADYDSVMGGNLMGLLR